MSSNVLSRPNKILHCYNIIYNRVKLLNIIRDMQSMILSTHQLLFNTNSFHNSSTFIDCSSHRDKWWNRIGPLHGEKYVRHEEGRGQRPAVQFQHPSPRPRNTMTTVVFYTMKYNEYIVFYTMKYNDYSGVLLYFVVFLLHKIYQKSEIHKLKTHIRWYTLSNLRKGANSSWTHPNTAASTRLRDRLSMYNSLPPLNKEPSNAASVSLFAIPLTGSFVQSCVVVS